MSAQELPLDLTKSSDVAAELLRVHVAAISLTLERMYGEKPKRANMATLALMYAFAEILEISPSQTAALMSGLAEFASMPIPSPEADASFRRVHYMLRHFAHLEAGDIGGAQ